MIEMGRGDYANPASVLKACAMLLRHIARPAKAQKLEDALAIVSDTLNMSGELGGNTCREFADAVMKEMAKM
jgi:isocitrate dehydrogenase (NAD+)